MPIARLRGVIEEKGDDWAIVSVVGVGLLASVPSTTAGALTEGQTAALFTYLHVREDALALYGFATRDELTLFEQLIGVSGIGPRAALGLLSALDYADLTTAIAGGGVDALRRVPGIGQKTAERLVLELRDKVMPPAAVEVAPERTNAAAKREADAQTVAALVGLGYSQSEALAAAEKLPEDGELALEDRVRMALAYFSQPSRS